MMELLSSCLDRITPINLGVSCLRHAPTDRADLRLVIFTKSFVAWDMPKERMIYLYVKWIYAFNP